MKQRFVRPDAGWLSDDSLVIRGGELEYRLLVEDALRSHAVYGILAISVFAADTTGVDELVQVSPLVRFESVTVMKTGAIREAGLELVPTGRHRLHYSIDVGDLDAGLDRLIRCGHRTTANPYYSP